MSATKYAIRPLRADDLDTFPAVLALGVCPRAVAQTLAYTGLADGQVIVCAGIVALGDGVGEAWAVVRQPVDGHGRWIARTVRAWLYGLAADHAFRRVQAIIRADRPDLQRWAAWLGMTAEGPDPTRPEQLLYAMTRRA